MESSVEASQSGGPPKLKPSLGPKPRLAPKPFSLQKSTAVRSINAPKTVHAAIKSQTEAAEKLVAAGGPKFPLTAPVQISPQPTSVPASPSLVGVSTKAQATPSNASEAPPHKDGTPTTPPKQTPDFEPAQKDNVVQTNHKTSPGTVTNSEQEDNVGKEDETRVSVSQKPKDSSSDGPTATSTEYHRGGSRKRLSMELTSKFESGGPLPPPQPVQSIPKAPKKTVPDKPASPAPEQSPAAPEPWNTESDAAGEQGEDYGAGNSIKLRISRLFDSVSKPEVTTKREELEIPNGIGGVKEQIKNWAAETGSESPTTEKKPQGAQRISSKR